MDGTQPFEGLDMNLDNIPGTDPELALSPESMAKLLGSFPQNVLEANGLSLDIDMSEFMNMDVDQIIQELETSNKRASDEAFPDACGTPSPKKQHLDTQSSHSVDSLFDDDIDTFLRNSESFLKSLSHEPTSTLNPAVALPYHENTAPIAATDKALETNQDDSGVSLRESPISDATSTSTFSVIPSEQNTTSVATEKAIDLSNDNLIPNSEHPPSAPTQSSPLDLVDEEPISVPSHATPSVDVSPASGKAGRKFAIGSQEINEQATLDAVARANAIAKGVTPYKPIGYQPSTPNQHARVVEVPDKIMNFRVNYAESRNNKLVVERDRYRQAWLEATTIDPETGKSNLELVEEANATLRRVNSTNKTKLAKHKHQLQELKNCFDAMIMKSLEHNDMMKNVYGPTPLLAELRTRIYGFAQMYGQLHSQSTENLATFEYYGAPSLAQAPINQSVPAASFNSCMPLPSMQHPGPIKILPKPSNAPPAGVFYAPNNTPSAGMTCTPTKTPPLGVFYTSSSRNSPSTSTPVASNTTRTSPNARGSAKTTPTKVSLPRTSNKAPRTATPASATNTVCTPSRASRPARSSPVNATSVSPPQVSSGNRTSPKDATPGGRTITTFLASQAPSSANRQQSTSRRSSSSSAHLPSSAVSSQVKPMQAAQTMMAPRASILPDSAAVPLIDLTSDPAVSVQTAQLAPAVEDAQLTEFHRDFRKKEFNWLRSNETTLDQINRIMTAAKQQAQPDETTAPKAETTSKKSKKSKKSGDLAIPGQCYEFVERQKAIRRCLGKPYDAFDPDETEDDCEFELDDDFASANAAKLLSSPSPSSSPPVASTNASPSSSKSSAESVAAPARCVKKSPPKNAASPKAKQAVPVPDPAPANSVPKVAPSNVPPHVEAAVERAVEAVAVPALQPASQPVAEPVFETEDGSYQVTEAQLAQMLEDAVRGDV